MRLTLLLASLCLVGSSLAFVGLAAQEAEAPTVEVYKSPT